MNKFVKNVAIFGGAVAAFSALVGAGSAFATEKLMQLALNRQEPKDGKKKASGDKKISEVKLQSIADGEKLEQIECREVVMESFDGTMLVGHWYPCENAERVIVAMHGWRSTWAKNFGSVSEFWHANGCSVLFAEQRGQGESGGDYMSFGILERHDCVEWARMAEQELAAGLPVYLAGVSMGASTVLMASELDLPESVCGIVADCGFTAPHDIWESVVENKFHIPYELCRKRAERICVKRISESAKAHTCPEALKNCKVPVLFIHGTDDKFVPIRMTYENYKACTAPKRLLVVPGAEHGMSYLVDKEAYMDATKRFWDFCENK